MALTHIVRSRIRPVDPPRRRRWHLDRSNRFPQVCVAIIVVVLLAGAAAAWVRWEPTWPHHRPGAGERAQPGRSGAGTGAGPTLSSRASTGASSSPVSTVPGRPSPSSSRTSVGGSAPPRPSGATPRAGPTPSARAWPTSDSGWTAVLAKLDLTRQRAFAADDPVRLSGVYSDVALLRQDRATLRQVVAPGCHLIGLRTVYRGVHPSSWNARQVVLSTRASLTPARLLCPHRPPLDMAAHAPVAMTVVLEPVGGQFLIAAIQVPT